MYCAAKKDKKREEEEEEDEEEQRSDTLKMEGMNGTDTNNESDQDTLIDYQAASPTVASKLHGEEEVVLCLLLDLVSHFPSPAGLCVRLSIIKEIWQLIIAVFSSYLITLLVFPGLVSEVQYCPIGDWVPVILVTVFNVTDFIAKV